MSDMSNRDPEQTACRPDPAKLFLATWVFPAAYLCLLAAGLYLARHLVPMPPVRHSLAYSMLAAVVWAGVTGKLITEATKMSEWNRPAVFRSLAWPFVGFALLVVEYGIMGFFLVTSWRWFIFALILYQLLGSSGLVRRVCSWTLICGYLAVLAATQRRS